MRIKVTREKCTGCHLCEHVCSLFHLGVVNPEKSAIRIQKDDLETSMNTPRVCRQCKDMKCLEGEDVMEKSEKKLFIWYGTRAEKCPFDSLSIFGQNAYHCDLCGGRPQCVSVCTPKAIRVKR